MCKLFTEGKSYITYINYEELYYIQNTISLKSNKSQHTCAMQLKRYQDCKYFYNNKKLIKLLSAKQ